MLTSKQIRQQFIDYFVQKRGHAFVPSSPVVPHDDPTLLFTNAGMNQFKPYFLGTEQPQWRRVANTQKCIRAGGKHNDLEDVGKDTYHHTFFEMLGNWSFGDYFKAEAIEWAWDLLVNHWGLDPRRLHATYFQGDPAEGLEPDVEARELWKRFLPAERIHPGNKKDNFWEMGDTGPCGPCSEIHIDLTPDGDGGKLVNAGDARVMEIWNLVFIQFNRTSSGLSPLPARHVDTGMGFERICSVIQKAGSNYDTDVFTPIFKAIQSITGARPYGRKLDDKVDIAYRVIADHIRTLTFALTDGAVPSNEGRGYVLRRILRRAARHGWQTLDMHEPFLHRLVPAVVDAMGDAFPELTKNPQKVADIIKDEEATFARTIDRGIALFDEAVANAKVEALDRFVNSPKAPVRVSFSGFYASSAPITHTPETQVSIVPAHKDSSSEEALYRGTIENCPTNLIEQIIGGRLAISAQDAFKLHDTYGFPLDLTQVMAEERGMTVDVAGFDQLMEKAREKARGAAAGGVDVVHELTNIVQCENLHATTFLGYDTLEASAKVVGCYSVGELTAVVTDKTPFYAEAGGQVGDTGVIRSDAGAEFSVTDTQKIGDVYFHLGTLKTGSLSIGQTVELAVDRVRRARIMANHTATHVMNRALRLHVNREADQKGSLVAPDRLRFDFSHNAAVTVEQAEQVEKAVNADIASDMPVYAGYAPIEQARQITGLRAVFGEKYPPKVRVVSIGVPTEDLFANPQDPKWAQYSVEFCGGTHLPRTGAAQRFVIVSEEAVGKGVRRITALTGEAAERAEAAGTVLMGKLEAHKADAYEDLPDAIAQLTKEMTDVTLPLVTRARVRAAIGELQQKLKAYEKQKSKESAGNVVEQARQIADSATGPLIVAKLDGADGDALRTAMDVIRKKKPDAALLLGAVSGADKVAFIAAVPETLVKKGLKAGDWVREVAKVAGGGGGGRPDMAQAGGKDPAKLDAALQTAQQFAASKLN